MNLSEAKGQSMMQPPGAGAPPGPGPAPGGPPGAPPQGAAPPGGGAPGGGGGALPPQKIQKLAQALDPENADTLLQVLGALLKDAVGAIHQAAGQSGQKPPGAGAPPPPGGGAPPGGPPAPAPKAATMPPQGMMGPG